MNDVITWGTVVTVISVGSAAGGLWWKLYALTEQARLATEQLRKDNALQFAATAAVIADFKLEVARNYATNASIREVEERVVQAIERLGDRLDKFLDNRPRART